MPLKSLAVRYTAFAVMATIANLAAQRVVLTFDASTRGFTLAILTGTIVGLLIKYVLDKRWIFHDTSRNFSASTYKFSLYTLMAIPTTLIFWVTEASFWYIWHTDLMRETGALIGLAAGYTVKFQLDRRYVFSRREHSRPILDTQISKTRP